ncbi:DnaJ domain-containing protein [Flavobacterium macrobrachii]|uniref:J domain-containing protein n=1 Tax=Flavobacterium macrobrachii TaxID=591204 RepID=A0ABS2CSN9_9FLAO|nr:DnaJ domain-containing protein [Flavobacterium macrobrachii]MBM6497987.1 J domain-containing protein [Flavobacterium macrobrachii]
MKDYYKSLELNFGATSTDIKTAYRRLAKKYHPDLHFGNKLFEEKFKEINEAYSILNDKAKKDIYDINYQKSKYRQSTNNNSSNSTKNSEKKEQKQEPNSEPKTKYQNTTKEKPKNMINDFTNIFNTIYKNKLYRYIGVFAIIISSIYIYKKDDISKYYDEQEKKEKYELLIYGLENTKKFENTSIPSLDIPKLSLETKWKNELMYYKFTISSVGDTIRIGNKEYPPLQRLDFLNGENYFKIKVNTVREFTLNFLDEDGFKVHSMDIPSSEMSETVDDKGIVVGYSVNSNLKIKPELYKEFSKWEIAYTNY